VNQRLLDLRETLVPGLQPLSEFLERRFRPAMDSCAATAARQTQLSERIAWAAQLLQTRSEVEANARTRHCSARSTGARACSCVCRRRSRACR
jgi:uncharacterized membrane-anchored protein